MLVHLLLSALASGIHSGNSTTNSSGREAAMRTWSLEESVSLPKPNGTVEPDRAPSFGAAADELADLEAEVGLSPNAKLNLTTEDDERFQDQEQIYHSRHCLQKFLEIYSDSICGQIFVQSMEEIGAELWCSFKDVFKSYDNLTTCMELLSAKLDCYYPNPTVQDFFLRVHAHFFQACEEDEETLLRDAPHSLVVVLTLVPVVLIPFLVYLVVWQSNGRD